jgi:ribosomal-protein-alanine N-acetyltransferase
MPGALIERGPAVTLRVAEAEDAAFFQRAGANPDLRYPLAGVVFTREETTERIVESDEDRFIVCLDDAEAGPGTPDTDRSRPVGGVTVEDADWKRPELTYWIVPEAQGQGYGKEAVGLAVDYAFRTYATPAVGAGAYAFNDASRGLLESLGFEQEGVKRGYMFVDGAYRDLVEYGLRRDDWDAQDG